MDAFRSTVLGVFLLDALAIREVSVLISNLSIVINVQI